MTPHCKSSSSIKHTPPNIGIWALQILDCWNRYEYGKITTRSLRLLVSTTIKITREVDCVTYVQCWKSVSIGRISIWSLWNTKIVGTTTNVPSYITKICFLLKIHCVLKNVSHFGARLDSARNEVEKWSCFSLVSISTFSKWEFDRNVLILREYWNKFLWRIWVAMRYMCIASLGPWCLLQYRKSTHEIQ